MYEHSRRTLTIASLAVLATFLDTTILYVAFPDITATFSNASASELSWVLNAYTIVFAAMLIPAGKLADRVGHRKVFLAGSTVFTVASMACGLAPSAELLIVFRIVQAVGAAALIPSSLALVMHAFAHDQLPRAVAIWGAAGAVAGALGPTLGAAIVEGLGWRWAFFINLPVGIYTVIAGRRNLHESSDPDTQVPSPVGVILIAGAAGLLSYGLVGTEEFGWLSGRTFGVLVAGLVVLAVFIVHQQHTKAPALDLDLFRIANFRWANLAMLVFGTAFAALFFGSILFLTDVWGWSVLQAGFGVAPRSGRRRRRRTPGRQARRQNRAATDPHHRRGAVRRQRPVPLGDARPRRQLPARLLPVDGAQRPRCRVRLPPALQCRGSGIAARPRRRRWRRGPSSAPVRRHVWCRADHRFPRDRGRCHRWLRSDLVARRHRWTRHVRARPTDAHLQRAPIASAASSPPQRGRVWRRRLGGSAADLRVAHPIAHPRHGIRWCHRWLNETRTVAEQAKHDLRRSDDTAVSGFLNRVSGGANPPGGTKLLVRGHVFGIRAPGLSIQSSIYASPGGPSKAWKGKLAGAAEQDVEVDEGLGEAETYGVAHRLVGCATPRCTWACLETAGQASHCARVTRCSAFSQAGTALALLDRRLEASGAVVADVLRDALDSAASAGAGLVRFLDIAAGATTGDQCAGCPIAPTALESPIVSPRLRAVAARCFDDWEALIASRLRVDGWPDGSVPEAASAALALVEGALLLARVSGQPSHLVHANRALLALLAAPPADGEHQPRTMGSG